MDFRFQSKLYTPPGCERHVDPRESPLGQDVLTQLFESIKAMLTRDRTFQIIVGDSLAASFSMHGQTAGVLRLCETRHGAETRVHAFAVFLPGLDDGEDRAAINAIRSETALAAIPREAFDAPLNEGRPCVAIYFSGQDALDCALVYDVVKATYGAFFDQFGMGEDD